MIEGISVEQIEFMIKCGWWGFSFTFVTIQIIVALLVSRKITRYMWLAIPFLGSVSAGLLIATVKLYQLVPL